MKPKLLAQGAEAKIILSNNLIIKDRISKSYRIKELDDKIRKQRTKAEKKLLEKVSKIINAPKPFNEKDLWYHQGVERCHPSEIRGDSKRNRGFFSIEMPFIEGKKLSEHLDSFPLKKQKEICRIIGEQTAKIHEADIIHGDLTTSNMILVEGKNIRLDPNSEDRLIKKNRGFLYFIDFGLGFHSKKIEDKAVDLHLLKQALEAKHFKNWKELFEEVKEGYKKIDKKEAQKVLERLKAVEKRGRYKER